MRQGQSSRRMCTGTRRRGSTSNSIQMLSESKVIVSIDSKALEMALGPVFHDAFRFSVLVDRSGLRSVAGLRWLLGWWRTGGTRGSGGCGDDHDPLERLEDLTGQGPVAGQPEPAASAAAAKPGWEWVAFGARGWR
jgi:hypothetical protein